MARFSERGLLRVLKFLFCSAAQYSLLQNYLQLTIWFISKFISAKSKLKIPISICTVIIIINAQLICYVYCPDYAITVNHIAI